MSYNVPSDLDYIIRDIKKKFGGNGNNNFQFLIPLIALIIGIGAYTSFYTVEPDEEAVIIRLGKYIETTPPGLHFKLPYRIDRHIIVQTTKIHQLEFGFRTTEVRRQGHSRYSNPLAHESLMLTGDLNVGEVEWVVQYKISDPYKYLFRASNPVQNIRDVSESIMRRVVGDRSVNEVLTTGRVEISDEAKELTQALLDEYDIGIYISSVKLQDVNPPEVVRASFNEVNAAKQEQEKVINQAEESYNKVIPAARGKADELISQAEGYALSKVNRAEGDADKFKAISREYKRAPSITKKRLYLEAMEEIFSKLEKVTIVDKDINGLLPIYNQIQAPQEKK